MSEQRKAASLWDKDIVSRALVDSIWKFDPRVQIKNPVMFVVEVTALAVTIIIVQNLLGGNTKFLGFEFQIAIWLWFTVGFANFAEAMAEGRGKAQADNLRKTRTETHARLLKDGKERMVPATELRRGDIVLVRAGEVIAGDWRVNEDEAQHEEQQQLQCIDNDDGAGDAGKEKQGREHEQGFAGIEAGGLEDSFGRCSKHVFGKGRQVGDGIR